MAADSAPFTPLPLSVLRFMCIESYGYTDQRKVEADVEVTEDRTGDLSLRKPRTSQLSHACYCNLPMDLFSMYILFFHFSPSDAPHGNFPFFFN